MLFLILRKPLVSVFRFTIYHLELILQLDRFPVFLCAFENEIDLQVIFLPPFISFYTILALIFSMHERLYLPPPIFQVLLYNVTLFQSSVLFWHAHHLSLHSPSHSLLLYSYLIPNPIEFSYIFYYLNC